MTKIIEGKVISSISTKNQIVVPPEVLMTLGLHPRDKIVFEIRYREVKLRSAKNTNIEVFFDSTESIKKSDNLKLPEGYKVEYQVQKVIKRDI